MTMPGSLDLRPILLAARVRLEPLIEAHRDELSRAAVSPEVWTHMPYDASGGGYSAWFEQALSAAQAEREAVWVVRSDGELVGSTRYLAIEPAHRRLEIGHTWYAPRAWGTRVNPACKFALLRYAFETLGFNRIELKTDSRNLRSQAAILKLGATREGVFRSHMLRRDGTVRDSVYFSIIREEWPQVRDRLSARLLALAQAGEPAMAT